MPQLPEHLQFGVQFVNRVIRGKVTKDCLYDNQIAFELANLLKHLQHAETEVLEELIDDINNSIATSSNTTVNEEYGKTQLSYTATIAEIKNNSDTEVELPVTTHSMATSIMKSILIEWKSFLEEFPPEGLDLGYNNINGF